MKGKDEVHGKWEETFCVFYTETIVGARWCWRPGRQRLVSVTVASDKDAYK